MMSGIRGKNTSPELMLRRKLYAAGLRYRLHGPKLPGRPDMVMAGKRIVIFVHGCFWHRHDGCHWCSTPASNIDFWEAKFARNRARDAEVSALLREADWRVATAWECGLRPAFVDETIEALLGWIGTDLPVFESRVVRWRQGGSQSHP